MAYEDKTARRVAEVWRCLNRVMDPELDESITDMGFVERVSVDDDAVVTVEFRLPTYWCSPSFAFLMADGIRIEVERLSWVSRVLVYLQDHLSAEEMNAGVNEGRTFSEVFAEISDDSDLDEIRQTFLEKAFKRRQETVLLGLRDEGLDDARIVAMTLGDLDAHAFRSGTVSLQKHRYREVLIGQGLAGDVNDPAFVSFAGDHLSTKTLDAYLSDLRGVRINMEFNGALCRGLSKTRYKTVAQQDGEPTLVDFILDRVPPADPPRTGQKI